jgi:hypothetical protein
MFGIDWQMGLAKAWTDAALGCMTASTAASLDMASQTLSLWSRACESVVSPDSPATSKTPATTKTAVAAPREHSWYRPPSQSPFDFGAAAPAGAFPFPLASGWPFMPAPMNFLAWPGLAAPPTLLQPWAALMAAFGIFAFPPRQAFDWRAFGFGLPVSPWFWSGLPFGDPLPGREQPAPFAVYRSNGGHAVAQVTFPNQVIAAVAFPPAAAALAAGLFRRH